MNEPQNHSDEPAHEMPPMGEGLMSWGFAGFFLLPVVLIGMVFMTPMCMESSQQGQDLVDTVPMIEPTPPAPAEEN